ncbi:MAG: aminopeptidase P family protein [Phycisphaeraceae bacterium]|nr:aminopeptidase P family protein [Phycisphaeraceae bacterium]
MARKVASIHHRSRSRSTASRLRLVRKRIRSWGCSGLLVTNPRDIRYLTGFVGEDSWAWIPAVGGKPHILSDARFDEQIDREAPGSIKHIRSGGLAEELKRLLDKRKSPRIALQSDHVTLAQRRTLNKVLGAGSFKEVDDGLLAHRAIKDKDELSRIRAAAKIQQEAFSALLKSIEPGMTERHIAALLEFEMGRRGASGPAFPTIVAADANAALPHAIPGRQKARKRGILLIDWGAVYEGYCSDMTRVVAFGSMPRRIREIYAVVLEAQTAAIEAIRPGRSMIEVDAVARKIIEKAGYAKRFGHGLGHGLGLDIHELPVLSFRGKGCLEPGQVVTVEPGIYLPGIGGVRIEDDVLVTPKGYELLTHLPKDLESAII